MLASVGKGNWCLIMRFQPCMLFLLTAVESHWSWYLFFRWHLVTMTIDADLGEATCYLDGGFDGYQTGLPLHVGNTIWEQGTEVWVGVRPPTDMDAFGRSDSEGAESKMHIMDVFLWGRCLTEDDIVALHAAVGSADTNMIDFPEDAWQWADSPSRVCIFCLAYYYISILDYQGCNLVYDISG